MTILIKNKRAGFDYEVVEKFTAGLVLSTKMVKRIRAKNLNLQGLYIINQQGQLQIIGVDNGQDLENITLLLNKKEKAKFVGLLSKKGLTGIVFNLQKIGRWLKAEVAVVRGKKQYDKRKSLKEKTLKRESQKGLLA